MSENENQLNQQELYEVLEKLISPQPNQREEALDQLYTKGLFTVSPLAAYLLATRVVDNDIEVRYHAIRYLGSLLDYERPGNAVFNEQTLKYVHNFFLEVDETEVKKILEIADIYLAAENFIKNILKICSCAGQILGGIVNDRKNPPNLRRQAVFFSGEIGFVEMVPILENLIQRTEKSRKRSNRTLSSEQLHEEEELLIKAIVALDKMKSGPVEKKLEI